MTNKAKILIVDMGSQYTRLIERILREQGFRSAVLSPEKASTWLVNNPVQSVIISGGNKSVNDVDAPSIPQNIVDAHVPKLGICYGMQWLMLHFGGEVITQHTTAGFGPVDVTLSKNTIFDGVSKKQSVWASHSDSVIVLPSGTNTIAVGNNGFEIEAIHMPEHDIWGVQFHPEVDNTNCGVQILLNFVHNICNCTMDWQPTAIVDNIRSELTDSPRAILGFSGGVDSTVVAAILAPTMGDALQCICIDAGHLRKGEMGEIRSHAKAAKVKLKVVNAEGRFFSAYAGIADAEKKRAAFKKVYNQIFLEEADAFGATHIVQGTLATDLIESGATGGAVIKSHHNVGLDWKDLKSLQPLSSLFKYEVRELAAELDLPDSVVNREPFPGPGLFLRMPGVVTRQRRDIIRDVDATVRDIVRTHPDTPELSQLVIALSELKVVGVKGDARVYEEMVVVRPVQTIDFMTASSPIFSNDLMNKIMTEVSKYKKVCGVWWDFNPKPPRTTELE